MLAHPFAPPDPDRPRLRLRLRAVRRIYRLAWGCAVRGDDPLGWGSRLVGGVGRLMGTDRVALAFPGEDRLIAGRGWGGPAGPSRRGRRGRLLRAALLKDCRDAFAALPPTPGRAAVVVRPDRTDAPPAGSPARRGGDPDAWELPALGVVWRDAAGRPACLLLGPPTAPDVAAPGPRGDAAADLHLYPAPPGSPPPTDSGGPCEVRERLLRHLAVELGRFGRRLAHPGDRCPSALPARARQVLEGLLHGSVEKEIAVRLGVTPGAVHKQVHRIYRHFGVNSRAELLTRWIRRGWSRRCDWRAERTPADG